MASNTVIDSDQSNTVVDSDQSEIASIINLLRLVVTQGPDALKQLKHAHTRDTKLKPYLDEHLCFWYYNSSTSSDSCACWYDLEYFSFINGKAIDTEKFNTVCSNLQRGTCPHVLECEQNGGVVSACRLHASTTLLHAAAAVGNVQVAKFLKSDNKDLIYKSTLERQMKPLHLALIKSQCKVLKYLHFGKKHIFASKVHFLFGDLELAVREMTSGKISIVSCPLGVSNQVYILKLFDITDEKLVGKAMKIGIGRHCEDNLDAILAYFLLNKDEDRAVSILTNRHVDVHMLKQPGGCRMALMACALADADTCLRILLKTNSSFKLTVYRYNILNAAQAVGSQKCVSILQPIMKPDDCCGYPPFMFLYLISVELKLNTASVKTLLHRCVCQGFDINAVDISHQCTAIGLGVKALRREIVVALLEEGSDINTTYRNTALISVALQGVRDRCGPGEVFYPDKRLLMDLLLYNPSACKAPNVLDHAVEYDLGNNVLENGSSLVTHDPESENAHVIGCGDMTSNDAFLSASTSAVLYELGFQITESCLEQARLRSTRNQTALALYTYLVSMTSCTRSLKSSCRIALREAFPGNRLHAYLSDLDVPLSVVDYVIRPWFLRSD